MTASHEQLEALKKMAMASIMMGCLLLMTGFHRICWGKDSLLTPTPPACPTCCETLNPYPGISADDLMKIKYYVKYTKFADDYEGIGFFKMLPPKGPVRSRYWKRYRIILNKRNDLIDYKDMITILGPQNIRGLSVLTWTYLDPEKDQEVWSWIPSLRKVRRISQSEEADSFMGSEFTTEDVSTRKWEDETYKMVGEKTFKGYLSTFHDKTFHENTRCYRVEAKPKRKDWYYSKRVMWIDKQSGGLIFDEVYDSDGRRWKTFMKYYEILENSCIPQISLEGADQLTRHKTAIGFNKDQIKFNTHLKESFFSEKTLMRSKW